MDSELELHFTQGHLPPEERESLLTREWLVTNGLGGYASGTLAGISTRAHHGLLIAAHPAPQGRWVMLNHLTETLELSNRDRVTIGGNELTGGALELEGMEYLIGFRLEAGLPVWTFVFGEYTLEKRVLMLHRQNTVQVNYRLVKGEGPVRITLRPSLHFRRHDEPVSKKLEGSYLISICERRYEIQASDPTQMLRLHLTGHRTAFTSEPRNVPDVLYRVEARRGYHHQGGLWSPGYFRAYLDTEHDLTLIASTEDWGTLQAMSPEDARETEIQRRERLIALASPVAQKGPARQLVLAADQFIVVPRGRTEDAARAHAAGEEMRSVIAGYHWFTDWGRDTMISLEGLTLTTGRSQEAREILRTFARAIRDGLIPNLYPEGEQQGVYHTADATLWYFHALDRYLATTSDFNTLEELIGILENVLEHHLEGTHFNIGVDPDDGLLHQGEDGYQLTWMDAKVEDWVVTPRRGKAVEINALWYNALRLMERWSEILSRKEQSHRWGRLADQVRVSFNQRFWYGKGDYLYDVVDGEEGDDPACRPNQIFALSLPHSVLDESKWSAVLLCVENLLLTPVGLRSLAPTHPDYKSRYYGDLRSRDAAYHQGTVWGWLIGPFVDAWLRVYPDQVHKGRQLLQGLLDHLSEGCVGSISEIFDADDPFTPRGCIAQAWSVAEVLRCWVRTSENR